MRWLFNFYLIQFERRYQIFWVFIFANSFNSFLSNNFGIDYCLKKNKLKSEESFDILRKFTDTINFTFLQKKNYIKYLYWLLKKDEIR